MHRATDWVLESDRNNRPVHAAREVFAVVAAFAMFPLVAHIRPGSAQRAVARGNRFVEIEKSSGLEIRQHLAGWTVDHRVVEAAAEIFYYSAHVSAVIGTGIVLAARYPHRYRLVRSTFYTAHALTIGCYLLWPVAPPRLLNESGPERRSKWSFVQYEFAAFPSGHVVFALVVGIALMTSERRWIRVLGVVYPVCVGLVTLATNNHHLLDLAAATVIVTFSSSVVAGFRVVAIAQGTTRCSSHPPTAGPKMAEWTRPAS